MTDDENLVEIRTALALAKLWDDPKNNNFDMIDPYECQPERWTHPPDDDYDDDYSAEAHLERKAKEGWTRCEECEDWLHSDDVSDGARCKCGEKEDGGEDEG